MTTTEPFDELTAAVTGTVLTAGDDGWDAARGAWALTVDQRPVAVVLAATTQDVTETVRFAARHGLHVAAQQGGHGATASVTAVGGTILLRTGALDSIEVHVSGHTARVGSGVTWGALLAALDGTGLVGVPGSNPHVSVVGYCLGGGLSWFGRAYGTGAATLRGVELVGADGDLRWVTGASDPELFWALRGGGGDFGIVTAVEIDLFETHRIYGGRLVFAGSAAPEVLGTFVDVTLTAPDELTLWASVMRYPDVPELPAEVRGQAFTMIDAMFVGGADDAEALLAPVRAAGAVLRETVRLLRPSEVGSVAEEPSEPSPSIAVARTLDRLDATTLVRLLEVAGPGSGTAITLVQLRHLGGALRNVAPDLPHAGVAVRVDAPYVLVALGILGGPPEREAAVRDGLAAVLEAVEPVRAAERVLTSLGEDESIADAYSAESVDRLRAVKRAVDPGGVFRSNYPVLAG